MISMSKQNSIRQRWRRGESVAEIARNEGVSRDTVYKYRDREDFSPTLPKKRPSHSKIDPYKPIIDQWLDDDACNFHKRRHTAKRIHVRLVSECAADVSLSTVERYVKGAKLERSRRTDGYLDLAWSPGEAQADFGEADFYLRGVRTRLNFFVLTFPFSNVGLVQVFPGENAECVCRALRNIFEYLGGVPVKIVFDNAAGVGRKACDQVRTTELFEACSAHYGFRYRFCNPYSGNEKCNVENKVGTVRRKLFVPVPQIGGMESYNEKLLDKCMALAAKPHWIKGEPEEQLFQEDSFALLGLPARGFECVTYITRTADKKGKVSVGKRGRHLYSSDPALARTQLTVGLRAATVEIYDPDGALACSHPRAYGSAPTDSTDPTSQLGLPAWNIGAWGNGKVRASLPDALRMHMDSLGKEELKGEVRIMRDQARTSGWSATVQAMEAALVSTGRVDEASVAVTAARMESGTVERDEPVDLSVYDSFMGVAR